MLRHIPLIPFLIVNSYFAFIDSNLTAYEHLKDVIVLLELAIWKWKITEQFYRINNTLAVDMRMRCRTDSVTAVTIIVPNVLSFLADGNNGNGDCNIWVDIFVSINSVDSDDQSLPGEDMIALTTSRKWIQMATIGMKEMRMVAKI